MTGEVFRSGGARRGIVGRLCGFGGRGGREGRGGGGVGRGLGGRWG